MFIEKKLRLGFIVNSYAGIGGEHALKGSDGNDIRQLALSKNAHLRAPERVQRFLSSLAHIDDIDWYCGQGQMGEKYLVDAGIKPIQLIPSKKANTTSEDTLNIALALVECAVDLVVFAGGDGTARDIYSQVEAKIPCLGMPTGVKMQSGVFALTPEAAAEIINGIVDTELISVDEQDIRDIDEQALREGRLKSSYYGSMLVPAAPRYLQHLKQGSIESEDLVLDELADHLTELLEDSQVVLVGPGSTTAYWMQTMGLENTLVGFDLLAQGELKGSDLDASAIEQALLEYPSLLIVLSPTGSQGALIGRGNQQLNRSILSRLNKEQFVIIATKSKLSALNHHPLLIDSNDFYLDKKMSGLYPIITSYHEHVLYPVNTQFLKEM